MRCTPSTLDSADIARAARVAELRARRPRARFVQGTTFILALGALVAWMSGQMEVGKLFEGRRMANLERFVTRDAMPAPLREGGGATELFAWIQGILDDRGYEALLATLALAVAAAVLAGCIGLALAPFAARTLATDRPYDVAGPRFAANRAGSTRTGPARTGPAHTGPARTGPGRMRLVDARRSGEERVTTEPRHALRWRAVTFTARSVAVLLRALPEYVLAFLLAAMLPEVAWAAVLALALHNGGILGRLYGETLENLPPRPFRAWADLGASRSQLAVLALLPAALPRFLLYFFYRFETCVREATVLGLLGVVSLGYWIQDARARLQYDTMLLLVGLGIVIVLLGDLCSYVARALVRRAA
jgi:phosphonate transport system permease protein